MDLDSVHRPINTKCMREVKMQKGKGEKNLKVKS